MFNSVGLRHKFMSRNFLVMGVQCIEELDIAFMHANSIRLRRSYF